MMTGFGELVTVTVLVRVTVCRVRRSVGYVVDLTQRQAEELLIQYASVMRSRDDRVRAAFAAGVGKSEIFRLTGIARTTIDRIVTQAGDGPHADSGEGGTP